MSGDVHLLARGWRQADRVFRISPARLFRRSHFSVPHSRVRQVSVCEELALELDAGVVDSRDGTALRLAPVSDRRGGCMRLKSCVIGLGEGGCPLVAGLGAKGITVIRVGRGSKE